MFQVEDISSGEQKIVSRSKARVIANEDPQMKGRIRVFHPLTGETGFLPYLSLPGMFSVPDVGDVVYLEAEAGYPTHCIAYGNLNSEENGIPDYPDEFQRVTPSNRGFFTPGGHLVELDDGTGPAEIGKGIRITSSGGAVISISDTDDTVSLTTSSGNSFTIDPEQINFEDTFGNTITTSDSGIKLKEFTGAELNLSEGKVALGGPTAELMALLDQVLTQLGTLTQTLSEEAPAGFGAPLIGAATYLAVNTQLTTIQTQFDTIKGSL